MSKKDAASNDELSEKALSLVKRTLISASEYTFKEGVSDDMMAVFIGVANKVLDGIIATFPQIFNSLTEDEVSQFKNSFYEAVGVGYKVYWAERKFLKNENDFVKFKGTKFQNYLLGEYESYFVNLTKDPEPLTPSYVMEAINYFGIVMFKGAFVEGDKIELLKKFAAHDQGNAFLEQVNTVALLKSLVWTGYILCKAQDEYRLFAGNSKQESNR